MKKRLDVLNVNALETWSRDDLLTTLRLLMAEANALSSRINAVNEIGLAINSNLSLAEILDVVTSQAKWLLDFDCCAVFLVELDTSCTTHNLFGSSGDCPEADLLNSPNLGAVLKRGHPFISGKLVESPVFRKFQSQMILPLRDGGKVIGAIGFADSDPARYTQEDARIAYLLASQLGAAIRNARQIEALRAAEARLTEYATELEQRNRELDAYTHTIAHDLKTPLTSIPIKLELIERLLNPAPERVVSHLHDARLITRQMATMIDQLLQLAKLRNAAEKAVVVNADDALAAALRRLQHLIDERGVAVTSAPNLPMVLAQEQWLEEVFANLISNAVKYIGSDNAAPRISITGRSDGAFAHYEITDNGLGIPPEKRATLFEKFERFHPTQAEGTGLGLNIVQRIITNLRGTIGVRDADGGGTTFWFKLPAAAIPLAQAHSKHNEIAANAYSI